MAEQPPITYQRLPGTGYRRVIPDWAIFLLFFVIGIFVFLLRGRRVQLWLGNNHLLLVEWDGTREYYKRYYFQDIQAFTLRRTADGRIYNLILGAFITLFCLIALAAEDPNVRIAWVMVAAFFALILLINTLIGPTCVCHLRTAVQVEELSTLIRLRTARKVLNRIRPHIVAAQGELRPEDIPARMRELVELTARSPAGGETGQGYIVDDPNVPPRILS